MGDSSSRSLLAPSGGYTKHQSAWKGQRSTYKLPGLILTFLTLLIGCIIASIFVLLGSHEDVVGSWSIRPSILLSVLAGVYAIVLGGLFTAGVAVIWWRSIIYGTTLKRLHYIHAGASPKDFIGSFLAGGHATRVALAALVVFSAKLAIGPLLQRSTKPEMRDVTRNISMNIRLAPEIPDGTFGQVGHFSVYGIFMQQLAFYGNNFTTEKREGYSCPGNGTCEGRVTAAGLNFDCGSSSETFDLLDPANEYSTVFSIDIVFEMDDGLPQLFLDSKYISAVNGDCIGTLTTTSCKMIPATMLYPLTIKDGILVPNLTDVLYNPAVIKNYTSAGDAELEDLLAPMGPLQGTLAALGTVYRSEAYLVRSQTPDFEAAGYDYTTQNRSAPFWANMFLNTVQPQSIARCPLVWDSPVEHVMMRILDLMFKTAYSVALTSEDKNSYKQTFDAVYSGQELWYITDFGWLAASVAVMVLGSIAAMSLLWGWWQLDRYVTLSPLETGKAFGAPVLTTAGPEQEARAIIKEVGHERVAHDGDELVWNGTVYATGIAGTPRNKYRSGAEESGLGEMMCGSSGHSSLRGRGHRRGMSSVSDASPSQARPSFEHSFGVTTRRPYDDEEELDTGQYGRPRSRSRGSDTIPMLPLNLTPGNGGSPKLPPIPPTGSIKLEPLSPVGRPRRSSRGGMDALAMGKRPLSKIEERNSPTP
ncbi:hypothetical protein BU26DRAFT_52044 [Trematosphaeria pertusa]|uniref:Uncharacterized protein n=1 Tax=Trematosphaeria pertusa TaxID=390896 RepID=A0A6A6IB55_9PLEO|nr:uncharacterized protein BU26DRAFT_52044 [Trematosphaeria pertusa]KAF2246723.1 hypothetical protein BU26DRAFT_52044 [Trematosphaeria pertusa]